MNAYSIAPGGYSLGIAPPPKVEFRRGAITMQAIQNAVTAYYSLAPTDLTSQRRSREIAWPRQLAMHLCKELTHHSLPNIGRAFGNRDHTTVLHALRAVKERLLKFAELREDIETIRESLSKNKRTDVDFICGWASLNFKEQGENIQERLAA